MQAAKDDDTSPPLTTVAEWPLRGEGGGCPLVKDASVHLILVIRRTPPSSRRAFESVRLAGAERKVTTIDKIRVFAK